MRKITLLLTLTLFSIALFGSTAQRELYIEQYKHLAISEMHRTGIPASIKLAQAILESNAGQSTLAREANNHFGIKCGSYWDGKKFYRKDDDRNKRGKLIKSCFRAFKDPVDSFIEHSEFLYTQNRKRYDFLFNYSPSDYTNWAYGLKKAGYATHREYPTLLIKLIEEYQLYKYDNPGGLEEVLVVNRPSQESPIVHTNTAPIVAKKKRSQPNIFSDGAEGEVSMDAFKTKVVTEKVNKVLLTYATQGDDVKDIAARSGVSIKKLIKFNDGIDARNQKLHAGTKIYLAKKKKKYSGRKKFHFVKAEDNMISIAQSYGIQKTALYMMNGMQLGTEPAIGEKIRLKGKMSKGKAIQIRKPKSKEVIKPTLVSAPIFEAEEPALSAPNKTDEEIQPSIIAKPETNEVFTQSSNDAVTITWDTPVAEKAKTQHSSFHIVQKGDTLWSISRKYEMTVSAIQKANNLIGNTIHVGQHIKIN